MPVVTRPNLTLLSQVIPQPVLYSPSNGDGFGDPYATLKVLMAGYFVYTVHNVMEGDGGCTF